MAMQQEEMASTKRKGQDELDKKKNSGEMERERTNHQKTR
jgi:hypothetical protein